MLKLALLTATMLALAGSTAASARHVRTHHHYWGESSAYGYGGGTSALGRYCPAGQYPHSWPGGWRCQYANGDFSGAGRW